MRIISLDQEYVAGTYGRFPVELVSGKGSVLTDTAGKEYIDLGSGIGVTCFGFGDEQWVAAVTAQLTKLQHTSNLYYTEPCAALAKVLCEKTGMKKVFFGNSGAEANECAIKVASEEEGNRKVVGFVACTEEELAWLYVDPACMRRGIGRKLSEHVLQKFPEIRYIEALKGNIPALSLYESLGFRVIGIEKGQMPGNEAFAVEVYSLER